MKDSEINNIAIPETYLDKDEYVVMTNGLK